MKDWFERPYFFPLLTGILFSFSIALGVAAPGIGEAGRDVAHTIAKLLLALGFLALGGWFLHAFTQADRPEADAVCEAAQRASMFRFAYLFSAFSFALLVLPFTAMLRSAESPPDAGPIRLIRACVVVAPPPSALGASSPATAAPLERCPETPPPAKETIYYPWLVAVGGVVGLECGLKGSPCPGWTDDKKGPPMYRVQGGFIVPFFVVVFAFVGGVVNLTRRVPEYQKRSSCHFAGTATEPIVTLLEAREFVIFQIMQLLSSPFIAMVAFYAFEPKTITTAALIGFFAGFATESVLLLLRGMFNGLRPETTKTVAAVATAGATAANLHARVTLAGGSAAAKATIEVRRLPSDQSIVTSQVADDGGEANFRNVAPGTIWVQATLAGAGGATLTAPAQKVQLKAGETESVTLVLA